AGCQRCLLAGRGSSTAYVTSSAALSVTVRITGACRWSAGPTGIGQDHGAGQVARLVGIEAPAERERHGGPLGHDERREWVEIAMADEGGARGTHVVGETGRLVPEQPGHAPGFGH